MKFISLNPEQLCSPNMFRNSSYSGIVSNQKLPPFLPSMHPAGSGSLRDPHSSPEYRSVCLWAYVPEQHLDIAGPLAESGQSAGFSEPGTARSHPAGVLHKQLTVSGLGGHGNCNGSFYCV